MGSQSANVPGDQIPNAPVVYITHENPNVSMVALALAILFILLCLNGINTLASLDEYVVLNTVVIIFLAALTLGAGLVAHSAIVNLWKSFF